MPLFAAAARVIGAAGDGDNADVLLAKAVAARDLAAALDDADLALAPRPAQGDRSSGRRSPDIVDPGRHAGRSGSRGPDRETAAGESASSAGWRS